MPTITYPDPLDPYAEDKSGPFHDEVRQWILDNPQDDPTPEPNEYIPTWNKGLKGVQESWNKGKTGCFSLESRKKMSESTSASQIGEKNPFYGKSHSAETKKQISDANKGNAAWNRGKKMSPESRKKLSDSCKGRVPWNKGLKYTHNCSSKKIFKC